MTQRENNLVKVTQQVRASDSQIPGPCLLAQDLCFTARDHHGDRGTQLGSPREMSRNGAPPLFWIRTLFLVSAERGAPSPSFSLIRGQQPGVMKCLPRASVVLGERGDCKEPPVHQQSLWRLVKDRAEGSP